MNSRIVLVEMFLLALWFSLAEFWSPVVETTLGPVMGNRKSYKGQKYDEFLGIPFGAPPVGKLRWKKPQPVEPWAPLIYDATKFSVHCTQFISILYPFIGMGGKSSEDCLYLNVWVPVNKDAGSAKIPVIFWVFGGGFILGTGEMYPGHLLAMHSNAVVVTFNYRVSSLGWLSSGDENMPGNYGLWDTEAALRWIRDHIGSFGGDPHLITAVGQSAGASIVSHVMISKKTNELITSAICLSGTSTGYFGLSRQPLRLLLLLAQIFDCPTGSTKEMEECLREIDAESLDFWGAMAQKIFEKRNPTLLPVIDGDFIVKHPKQSFLEGAGRHVNLMSGFLKDDAAGFVFKNPIGFPGFGKNNSVVSNESLWQHMRQWYGFLENKDEIIDRIVKEYPSMNTSDVHLRGKSATQAFTEAWFASSSNWESTTHSSFGRGKTYQYLFKHRQTFITAYESWINGSHTDDIYSVFGPPYMQFYRKLVLRKDFTEADYKVNEHFMSYIANFVHTGDPNRGHHNVPARWPVFSNETQLFVELSATPRIETFNAGEVLERFRFHGDLPNHYLYPPQPSIPPKLKESDIDEAIESTKRWLSSVIDNSSYKLKVNEMISNFKRRRPQLINRKRTF